MTEHDSILFQLLRHEHAQAEAIARELEREPRADERMRLRDRLIAALEQHMRAEERVLYPWLGKVAALRGFVDRMQSQHAAVRDALATLNGLPADSSELPAAVQEVMHALARHVKEEENALFEHCLEYLGGELETIAVEIETVRREEEGAFGVG